MVTAAGVGSESDLPVPVVSVDVGATSIEGSYDTSVPDCWGMGGTVGEGVVVPTSCCVDDPLLGLKIRAVGSHVYVWSDVPSSLDK